ncbi:hypothetical protein M3J09_004318 [Ascochyta lentis]
MREVNASTRLLWAGHVQPENMWLWRVWMRERVGSDCRTFGVTIVSRVDIVG